MKDTIEITFTAEDVENAKPYVDSCGCLVATALHRLGYKEVIVKPVEVLVDGNPYKIEAEGGALNKVLSLYYGNHQHVRKSAVGQSIMLALES